MWYMIHGFTMKASDNILLFYRTHSTLLAVITAIASARCHTVRYFLFIPQPDVTVVRVTVPRDRLLIHARGSTHTHTRHSSRTQ